MIHKAAALFSPQVIASVAAIVLFGDTEYGTAFADGLDAKVKQLFHEGDEICNGGIWILAPHLTYGLDAL